MMSYQATQTKNVLMHSTMDHDKNVSDVNHKKPLIIRNCNKKKGDVEAVDEMAKRYTTRSKVLRWPMVHFKMCSMSLLSTLLLCCLFCFPIGQITTEPDLEDGA